jgi:DNA (cytosine-5)-methyltransferase 1
MMKSYLFLSSWPQVEEFIMLTDPKLSLFTGEETEIMEADERPQHKITDFA